MIKLFILLVFLIFCDYPIQSKTKSVLITEEQRRNAVENAKKYDWAKEIQNNAIGKAESWLIMSDEELCNLVTDQSITRDIHTNTKVGCPNCGDGILGFGNYPWEQGGEWKLQCPNCCEIFPKNDYKMYFNFKNDTSGILKYISKPTEFQYYQLDSLYQTDIGFGMLDSNGYQHNIVAYYNHWFNWRGFILDALNDLTYAYTLTNDKIYAEKSMVILLKIAEVYPYMDYENQDTLFKNRSHFMKGIGGFASDRNWENLIVYNIILSYDKIFDGLIENNQFFENLSTKKYFKKKFDNIYQINNYFIENFADLVYNSIKNKKIHGNPPKSNRILTYLSIILQDENLKSNYFDYTFSGNYVNGYSTKWLLTEGIDRHGIGDECGDYGLGWSKKLSDMTNIFLKYSLYSKDSLKKEFPKFNQLNKAEYNLRVLNYFLPPIGDLYIKDSWRKQYRNINSNNIYSQNQIKNVKNYNGESIKSYILSDYGQVVLQKKNVNSDGFGLWIHFGNYKGHSHADNLNLGLIGYNFDLLPDIGYPDYANFSVENSHRWAWTSNTMSHNTLIINDSKSKFGAGGIIEYIYHSDNLQSLQVNSKYAYDSVDLYQRTLFQIEIDSVNSYAVDIFRASGGFSHHLSYHGASDAVTHNIKNMVIQKKGSFAGEDVQFKFISKEERKDFGRANGFSFLRDVERSNEYIYDNFDVNWKCKDVLNRIDPNDNINLKIHSLNKLNDVAFATGENPKLRSDILPTFRYMIQSRFGENLKSQFVNLIEPYKNKSSILKVENIFHKSKSNDSTNSGIVKITLKNGFTDYILSCNEIDSLYTNEISFYGKSGYIRTYGDSVISSNIIMGKNISFKNFTMLSENISIQGEITSINFENPENNFITVDTNIQLDSSIIGTYIHIKNSDRFDNSYEIKNIQGNKISFGDITLIKGFVDKNDYSKGHTYYVNPGDKFEIPLFKDYGIKQIE